MVSALAIFATAGVAASAAKPVNSSPPTISGTAQEGKTLTGNRGTWDNTPTDYNYFWRRCGAGGGSCSNISGANALTYTLKAVDIGNTAPVQGRCEERRRSDDGGFRTDRRDSEGGRRRLRRHTTTPSRGGGCPAGGNPDPVSAITSPAHLLIDGQTSNPAVVPAGVQTLVVRYHVTSTCGGPVQGALVYATATPFNQFSIPPETPTGADGWAELRFQRLGGFPVGPKQQLVAMFVRARKPGESILAGISARRLFSIRVNLHQ